MWLARSTWVVAAVALLTLLSTPAASQEGVPAIPYKQVPEIVPHVKEQLIPGIGDDDIDVAKIDLNMPPDGTPEYIVMLDNSAFCGSGGCTTEVVRIKPSGEIERLAGILRYSFGLAYSSTNGMLDLLTQSRSGDFIWRFDGKEYKPQKGHPKAATTKPADWTAPKVFAAKEGETKKKEDAPDNALGPLPTEPEWRPWKEVEELKAFFEEKGKGVDLEDTEVARLELNKPADGTPEYIVKFDGKGYCKSDGCFTDIIRLGDGANVNVLASVVGYEFRLAESYTNGMRELVTDGSFGKSVWAFDGKSYIKAVDPRPESLGSTGGARSDVSQQSDGRPKPYVGPAPRAAGCVGEYGWRRGYKRQGRTRHGYAVFGHCTDPENMSVRLNCRSDQRGVEVSLEIDPQTSGVVPVRIQVDRTGFTLNAKTVYSEMAGYGLPTFRLPARDRLINALARGQLARFIVGTNSVKIHLKGAARAINTMRRACPR